MLLILHYKTYFNLLKMIISIKFNRYKYLSGITNYTKYYYLFYD